MLADLVDELLEGAALLGGEVELVLRRRDAFGRRHVHRLAGDPEPQHPDDEEHVERERQRQRNQDQPAAPSGPRPGLGEARHVFGSSSRLLNKPVGGSNSSWPRAGAVLPARLRYALLPRVKPIMLVTIKLAATPLHIAAVRQPARRPAGGGKVNIWASPAATSAVAR